MDLSVLPSNTLAEFWLDPGFSRAIVVGLALSWTFLILFVVLSLRAKFGARLFSPWLLAQLDQPMVQEGSIFIGLVGFMISAFLKSPS